MLILLVTLIIFPITVHLIARDRIYKHVEAVTAATFGLIVAPFSLGLYSTMYLPIIGPPLSMVGLLLSFIHEAPGFELMNAIGLRHIDQIGMSGDGILIELLNGLIWAAIYGILGFAVDLFKAKSRLRRDG